MCTGQPSSVFYVNRHTRGKPKTCVDRVGPIMTTSYRSIAVAASTVLLWAAAFPAIRIGLRTFDAIPLAAVRFSIAGMLALAWLLWSRPTLPTPRDLMRFALCGAVGISIYNVLLNTGQQTVTAGAASFIINFQGVLTALLAMLFLGEAFNRWAWAGTLVCMVGVTVIASEMPGGLGFGSGATLVLAAAACSGTSFVLQRPLVAKYGAMTSAAVNILMGFLFLTPWLYDGLSQAMVASGSGIGAVVFLGVFPGAVGYMTWMSTLSTFGAARAANVLYLVPPVATAIAFYIADEVPGWPMLVGGLIVLAGVMLVNAKGKAN
jgi:drug/metabolite transporter (DMT)-like permease